MIICRQLFEKYNVLQCDTTARGNFPLSLISCILNFGRNRSRKFIVNTRCQMKPSERFTRIYGLLQKMGHWVGLEMYGPEIMITWQLKLILTVATISIPISYYTFSTSLASTSEAIQSFFPLFIEIQGIMRIVLFLKNFKLQYASMKKTIQIYENSEKSSPTMIQVLAKSIRRTEISVIVLIVAYIVLVFLYSVFCLIHFYLYDSRKLPYLIKLPYNNIASPTGYLTNISLQIILSFYCAVGLGCVDSVLIVFVMQAFTLADLFRCKLDEVISVVENLDKRNISYEPKVKKLMKEIVDDQRNYKDFIGNFMSHANGNCFIIISFGILINAACLVVTLTQDFSASAGIFFLSFIELFVACLIGAVIKVQVNILFNFTNHNSFTVFP